MTAPDRQRQALGWAKLLDAIASSIEDRRLVVPGASALRPAARWLRQAAPEFTAERVDPREDRCAVCRRVLEHPARGRHRQYCPAEKPGGRSKCRAKAAYQRRLSRRN